MGNNSLEVSFLGSAYIRTKRDELSRSIDSLILQDLKVFEIVLIIDGPVSEDVKEYILEIEESKVARIIWLPQNVGLGRALNYGLSRCLARIVLRYDTDDISDPRRVRVTLEQLKRNARTDICGSSVIEFENVKNNNAIYRLKQMPVENYDILATLRYRNAINHPTVAFKKSQIKKVGGYETCDLFEDYYLWLKCAAKGLNFKNISKPTVLMRRNGTIDRRSGIYYMLKELTFYRQATKSGYMNWRFLPYALLRVGSRLLPGILQKIQDFTPWRTRSVEMKSPDLLDADEIEEMIDRVFSLLIHPNGW